MSVTKVIGYIRVSTKEQGSSSLGLEAQERTIRKFAEDNNLELVGINKEVMSAKYGPERRLVLKETIAQAIKDKLVLVVSKLDRLSRKASLIFSLLETRLDFVVAEIGMRASTLDLHLRAVIAEDERTKIGVRTKDALCSKKERGEKLGNPRRLDGVDENNVPKMGLLSCGLLGARTNAENAKEFANSLRATVGRMVDSNMSLNSIAKELGKIGVKTARGGKWTAKSVSNLIAQWV